MITYEDLNRHAKALLEFCEYPAVEYKVKFSVMDVPYEDEELSLLREAFLKSDIVEEMYQSQDDHGGWGHFQSKDYSVKAKIPTSSVGIERCLHIGLTAEDRDILFLAGEYLKELLLGTGSERVWEKNERAVPWQRAKVCNLLEAIESNSSLCDETWRQWLFIAGRAYEDGEYSYRKTVTLPVSQGQIIAVKAASQDFPWREKRAFLTRKNTKIRRSLWSGSPREFLWMLDVCNKKCYNVCNKKCCGEKYAKGYLYQMLSVESKV